MEKKKQNNHIVKRYIIFILGLFVNSLGVALITKANLGTLANLIYSICVESELCIYIRKLYNFLQYSSDCAAVDLTWKEF